MKKTKIYQTKRYIVITALENHFQIFQIIQETNQLITLVIKIDHQNKEIHEISYKIDIVDQIVKIISIKTTIHDQIQTREYSFDTSSHSNSRNRQLKKQPQTLLSSMMQKVLNYN